MGYKDSLFQVSGHQKDIDLFFQKQNTISDKLIGVRKEADDNHIGIIEKLESLTLLHNQLVDTVKMLKQLYQLRGTSYFGVEGTIYRYARFLEDSTYIDRADIFLIRRREKDYMLRGDHKFADYVDSLVQVNLKKYSESETICKGLLRYKKAFDDFSNYSERINVNTGVGMYAHAQELINQLDDNYVEINAIVERDVANLNRIFNIILIASFIILLIASVYLSIVLSNNLTIDLKKLNKNVSSFIKSKFADNPEGFEPFTSKITEIQELNDDIIALKKALKISLADLEEAVRIERNTSVDLELSNIKLREKLDETQLLKHQVENSEAILKALFQSSSNCHILIGLNLEIILFNRAASSFIIKICGEEPVVGRSVLDYLPETYLYIFTRNYQKAISNEYVHVEQLFVYKNLESIPWDTSFVPVSDADGKIFAVSFNATVASIARQLDNMI